MRWTLEPKPQPEKISQLSQALQVDPIVATLLIQRGIETFEDARKFFRPSIEELHDPFLMKDMDHAVGRVIKALDNNENILVYGDYDVDGTTSVAMMYSFLSTFYPNVATYIPDRYKEGYGISKKGIEFASDNDISLIIALDCGIKAMDQVAYASSLGIDMIICDHHRPGDDIPDAAAVLDPKRSDCNYPYKELCGCGVGFKLIQAISARREMPEEDLLLYLDLVATAIAADIVPITGENRVLAYYGLQVINQNPRPGIMALIQNLNKDKLNITDVVFIIAPRINAAGRMKHGIEAVNLLVETELEVAQQLAAEIENFNLERKETDHRITEEALDQIKTNKEEDDHTTVVFDPSWHKGVIGIVASRLTETYYRPTVVFTKSGDVLAASARSVRGFDVYQALEKCSDHIQQFGGHKYAAGLTILPEKYEAFKQAFEQVVEETMDPALRSPELRVNLEIDLKDVNARLYRIVKQLAPFGPGNMKPVFIARGLTDGGSAQVIGADRSHLRLKLQQGNHLSLAAIGFGMADKIDLIKSATSFKAAFCLDENHWQGKTTLQLRLKDLRE